MHALRLHWELTSPHFWAFLVDKNFGQRRLPEPVLSNCTCFLFCQFQLCIIKLISLLNLSSSDVLFYNISWSNELILSTLLSSIDFPWTTIIIRRELQDSELRTNYYTKNDGIIELKFSQLVVKTSLETQWDGNISIYKHGSR